MPGYASLFSKPRLFSSQMDARPPITFGKQNPQDLYNFRSISTPDLERPAVIDTSPIPGSIGPGVKPQVDRDRRVPMRGGKFVK